jgi:hypothetical protein
MDTTKIKKHLPTVTGYIEKRKKAKQNQLPKHLRPPEVWPIWIQIVLNIGLVVALMNLMIDRDDYMTEAGPAVILVICFLLLIYTLISAVSLRRFYAKIRGEKLAKINFVLMVLAFLCWAGSIVAFLP